MSQGTPFGPVDLDWGDLRLRSAGAADSDAISDLVLGDAHQETTRAAMKLFGLDELERVRSLFRVLWRSGENWRQSVIAYSEGEPVGVLQRGPSGLRVTPRLVVTAVRAIGPVALARIGWRMRIQSAVSPRKPPGAYVISELHVAVNARGRGIGRQLLDFADREARELAYRQMALHTLTSNPARNLYTRQGFVSVEVRSDKRYERLTGVAGNVLMVKDFAVNPAAAEGAPRPGEV